MNTKHADAPLRTGRREERGLRISARPVYRNFVADFTIEIRNAGLVVDDRHPVIGDGKIHRYAVVGDHHGKASGWAVLHVDRDHGWGVFGSWRSGVTGTWRSGRGPMDAAERRRFSAAVRKATQLHEAERARAAEAAAVRAATLWADAIEPVAHPYLIDKHVEAHGTRELGRSLTVPLRDVEGKLHSLEFIAPDGTKRFLTGGRKHGCMFVIGTIDPDGDVCVAEGFATAASVFEATGKTSVVAFDCGNLLSVGRALRSMYPALRITFCADNDLNTAGNPGLMKASAAAHAVGGTVAVPVEGFNDFNDQYRAEAIV